MISNENENQKMCTIPIVWIWLKWLSDATILHIDFKKIPGENPRTSPSNPPLPKAAYGSCEQVVWWSSGVPHPWWRCFSTIKANSTRTLPPELLCVCPRWKINCGKNCSLLYICRLCMVVFSKQITLLMHIIIHTNGTIKKITSGIIHWKKKFPALYGAEKNFCLWKNVQKIIQPDQTPPPPLAVKWSLPNYSCQNIFTSSDEKLKLFEKYKQRPMMY